MGLAINYNVLYFFFRYKCNIIPRKYESIPVSLNVNNTVKKLSKPNLTSEILQKTERLVY